MHHLLKQLFASLKRDFLRAVCFSFGAAFLSAVFLLAGENTALAVPPTPGYGSGAIGVDAANNLSVGTSTTRPETKFLIVASSTDTSNFALKILEPNAAPILVVRNDGSVGIGTSSPAYVLDVVGNIRATGNLYGTYFGIVSAGNVTAGLFGSLQGSTGNYSFPSGLIVSSSLAVATSTIGPQSLSVYGGGYFSGSVGIGMASPGYTLDVSGGLRATATSTFSGNVGIGVASPIAKLDFAASTVAAGGIDFGGDTTLYRSAANILKTDDSFEIGAGGVYRVNGVAGQTFNCPSGQVLATTTVVGGIVTGGSCVSLGGGGTVTSITMGNGLSSTQSPLTTAGTMSVVYGSAANTAAQGNVTHTGPSVGLGLSGGGGALAVGTAGTFATINLNMTGASCGAGTHMSFLSATGTGACTADTGGGAVSAGHVTAGLFGSLEGSTGNYSFPSGLIVSSSLAVATSTIGPQSLSVYGGGYFSGSVGIGTSTPSDRLTISGGRVRIQDESNGADYAKLVVGTSGGLQAFHIGSYTNIPVAFYTNASGPRMVVDTSGNVGIGDTSPASLLSVGSGDLFQVNSSGNIIKINNVTYSWPSAQATAAGQVLTNNGAGTLTWVAPGGGVTSVFGRTGAVVAASGDYNTSLVTENGNLYFTNARAQAAITGGASSIVTSNLTASVALVSDASGKVAASAVTAANLGSINQNLGTGNSPTFANITATTKVTAQQWDPVYTISGTNYATYGLAMTGSKEETTGVVSVKCQVSSVKCSAVLDFKNAEKGSDLWLFYQATDFGKNMENLVALLTPSFDGRVWYEKDPAKNTLTIYATPTTYNLPPTTYEVSYRLTANRFDWQKWGNVSDDQTSGGLLVPEK